MACGVPVANGPRIITDMSTSIVAAGKLMVAQNEGVEVPEGWVIDHQGKSTTDPTAFFRGGALLPFGQHEGFAFAMIVDLLAGTLSGSSSNNPEDTVEPNNMLSILIDPATCLDSGEFLNGTRRFAEWVKS